MTVEIRIEADELGQLWPELSSPSLDRTLGYAVLAAIRDEWVRVASAGLTSSREAYLAAIGEIEDEFDSFVIHFGAWGHDAFARAIESGAPAWDMRSTMLGPRGTGATRVIKMDSGGGAPRPLAHQFRNRQRFPQILQKLQNAVNATSIGSRRLPADTVPMLQGKRHTTDTMAGGRVDAGGGVSVFRTMSWDSDARWIRPAIPAHNFADQALANVNYKDIMRQVLDAIVVTGASPAGGKGRR